MMRARLLVSAPVLAWLAAAATAVADPKPASPKPSTPPANAVGAPGADPWTPAEDWLDFSRKPPANMTTQSPSLGGGYSAGVVIDPGDHPDARLHPYGMVFHPPDVHDPMVLEPGTKGLTDGSRSFGQRLADGIRTGADTLWGLMRGGGSL